MRIDGLVELRIDGQPQPARLTAAGTALRLELPDASVAGGLARGARRPGRGLARGLARAGLTLRVYAGRAPLLVIGRGARAGPWRLLTGSRHVRPAGLRGLRWLLFGR